MKTDDDLFREWDLYDRIGRANYMRQEEISASIRESLRQRTEPLRVIDLGCGDGRVSRKVFAEVHVDQFVGVDLSESAIERLEQSTCPGTTPSKIHRNLICGDIGRELTLLPNDSFDVIHAGYSLHHYPTEAKPAVLDQIARILDAGGWLIWTDVVRDEEESREAFLGRLAQVIDTEWLAITPEERTSVIAHINQADFPEPESWMIRQVESRGLKFMRQLFRDDFHISLLFQK